MPSGGSRCTRPPKRSAHVAVTGLPPQAGRTRHGTTTTAMKSSISRTPGIMPARYSFGTEVLVSTASTIMLIEGGIRIPSVPPAASVPRNRRSL